MEDEIVKRLFDDVARLRENDEKFKAIVEKLSETMKKYQFDDYDEPVKALVKRLNAAVCAKPLKSPYIKRRGNSTELWAFALQTKDLMELMFQNFKEILIGKR